MIDAAMNIHVKVFVWAYALFFLGFCPGVESLGHIVNS